MKTCIACGMPMQEKEDFPFGDETKTYCVHCANEDGSMQTYEQKLVGMTAFIVQTQGLDEAVAQGVAKDMMRKLPAWSHRE